MRVNKLYFLLLWTFIMGNVIKMNVFIIYSRFWSHPIMIENQKAITKCAKLNYWKQMSIFLYLIFFKSILLIFVSFNEESIFNRLSEYSAEVQLYMLISCNLFGILFSSLILLRYISRILSVKRHDVPIKI